MGESTIEWAKRQKLSAPQNSRTNTVCEDCGRKWTATLTEVPVTIFIKDLDEYYKKLSHNLLEAVEPSMVLCVFRPSDRDIWDSEVTLSVVAPRQETPYHWRISHKFSGPAAASGCQISIWKADQSSTSKSDNVFKGSDIVTVTVKDEVKEEPKDEDEIMFEDVSIDPFAGNRSNYDPDDPEPEWTNSDSTDTFVKRFDSASTAVNAKIPEDRNEKSRKKANKWAVRVFEDWYTEKVKEGDYIILDWQTFSKEQLNQILARFYVEIRKQDGKYYSKQAYISIRAGIQRYLNDEPWFVPYSIISDPAFRESNISLTGVFKILAREGMDTVQHTKAIDPKDIEKLKTTNVIGTDNPLSLQRLVWFGIYLHFGRTIRDKYREMTKDTFVINVDTDGRRYLQQSYSYDTKNQVDRWISHKPIKRIYEQPNNKYCTVKAFDLYLSLIFNDVDCLWQRPECRFYRSTGIWYQKQVLGKNTLNAFFKDMCRDAGIVTEYTNHSVRITGDAILNEAGFEESSLIDRAIHKRNVPNNIIRKKVETTSNVCSEGQRYILPSTAKNTSQLYLLVPNVPAHSSVTNNMDSLNRDSSTEGPSEISASTHDPNKS